MEKEILNASEVAKLFKINVQRVYELCRSEPSFPYIRVGTRQYRFSVEALDKWIEAGGAREREDMNEKN